MDSELQAALDRFRKYNYPSGFGQVMEDQELILAAARLVANGKEVWLCGNGGAPMRPGKPLDMSCIFGRGHFEACGRYVLVPVLKEEK